MKSEIAERLAALPRLGAGNAKARSIPCRICDRPAAFFDAVDFNKCALDSFYAFGPSDVAVSYFRCGYCDFMFSPFFDDWTHEDFSRFIYNGDYVRVDPGYESFRPIQAAKNISRRLVRFKDARILDYGAGKGIFAEHMRLAGFAHVDSYDPFSLPKRPTGKYDIITCFEVLEHTPRPFDAFSDMHSFLAEEGGCILLAESLQPDDIDRVRANWWYVAPRNGHISTFSARTLALLASRFGMTFHRGKPHAFRRAGNYYSEAAAIFGAPLFCCDLGAPEGTKSGEGWHDLQQSQRGSFRWTSADRVMWEVSLPEGEKWDLQLRIPFSAEVRAKFAAECVVLIGDQGCTSRIQGGRIIAEVAQPVTGTVKVVLKTPEPKSPAELRDAADQRKLGLAINLIN